MAPVRPRGAGPGPGHGAADPRTIANLEQQLAKAQQRADRGPGRRQRGDHRPPVLVEEAERTLAELSGS